MRVKTDERRQSIIDAATELFQDVGYERASMAAISAKVGGSKQTLYSYFKSKEELFAAAMVSAMEEAGYQLIDLLDVEARDLTRTLERFGTAYLDFMSDPDFIRSNRVAIGAASSSDLGQQLFQLGPCRLWGEVALRIEAMIDRGRIVAGSAQVAALHLRGLLEAGYAEALLFGATPLVRKKDAVKAAIAVFLKAYGVGAGA